VIALVSRETKYRLDRLSRARAAAALVSMSSPPESLGVEAAPVFEAAAAVAREVPVLRAALHEPTAAAARRLLEDMDDAARGASRPGP
jgi:hypothetical protein